MSSALQHYMKLYSLEQTMESVKREADPERQDEIMQELRIDAIDQTNNLIEVKGTLTAANERVRKKMRTGKESILDFVAVTHQTDKTRHAEKMADNGVEDSQGGCRKCHRLNTFVVHTRLATKVCSHCGEMGDYQDNDAQYMDALWRDTTSHKQQSFSYKRSNHMLSWVLRIQGKENNNVTPAQLERIQQEFGKLQLDWTDHTVVTIDRLRGVLKTVKMPKLYSHVHSLRYALTGHAPPQMNEAQEHAVMDMFNDVTRLYDIVQKQRNIQRSNMLSYSIVLSKILEALGYDTFLDSLRLLKHRDRLVEQECIWRLICAESELHDDMPTFLFTQSPVF